MKIVIVQGAFLPVPPVEGGAVEKIWFRMGQEFTKLGHEVIHISKLYAGFPGEENIAGVRHLRVKGYDTPASLLKLKWLDLLYTRRALRKIPADADVIVTNTFWAPVLLRGKKGRKVYVDVQRVPKGQMRFYKHVGMLRGCSPAIYESIKKEMAAADHHLVSYVPNPVPFEVEPFSEEKEKHILFVGRLHPEKGVHVLIKAFHLLAQQAGGWKLVIVGPHEVKSGGGGTSYMSELKTLAGDAGNIELKGPVFNDEELKAYYKKAKIFCYPAQDDSGDAAPVAPREAMAYGCVPVVSRLGCFNDFISEGENGLYYDQQSADQAKELASSFSVLMNDNDLLKKMSTSAKIVSDTYSPNVVAKKFILDFEKLQNA